VNEHLPDLAALVFVLAVVALCICLVSYAVDGIRHPWWKRRFWSADREKLRNLRKWWAEQESKG
jgi:hypothetical protein